ncbi:MAG: hypothetical protein HKP58_10970 [Desulfatitalea sp.]|nr:hypothetical protein [Desulfatitalea sp.]NNK00922.1 hypothetical protein [Desulfatitalea sp.]
MGFFRLRSGLVKYVMILVFICFITPVAAVCDTDDPSVGENGSSSGAYTVPSAIPKRVDRHLKLALYTQLGLRHDQIQWGIAGSLAGMSPNILSELDWSRIVSYQLTLGGRAFVGRHLYLRGHFNYADIMSGEVRDSDYGEDNRMAEWSRSMSDTNTDQLWDGVAGAGYPLLRGHNRLQLIPMLGFSIHKQNLRITNGRQTISGTPPSGYNPPPSIGPLNSRLNSVYAARWVGWWLGCDVHYRLAASPGREPPMAWGLSLAYHFQADYHAQADWNLRRDLSHPVSFEHDAEGRGVSIKGDWRIRCSERLNFNIDVNYTTWTTGNGSHTVYAANGMIQSTRLNKVSWESYSVMLGLSYRFF